MRSQQRTYLFQVGCLALGYFLAARLSMTALNLEAAASPLWPPAGIALAALIWRRQLWPGVALGTVAVALSAQLALPTAIVVSLGSPLQAWLGSQLLRDRQLQTRSWQLPDLLAFLIWGVLVTPWVNAA